MKKFLTFGETMGQYNANFTGVYGAEGSYMLDCAGAESNVAVGLRKLCGSAIEDVWVSRLGDDEAGQFVLDELEGRISVKANKFAGENTGISYLNHHADGAHYKTYFRRDSAASRLSFTDVRPHFQEADVLHVTGITPALSSACHDTVMESLDYARKSGIPISFDLNYREQLWSPSDAAKVFERMAAYANFFKVGHDEAETICGWGWSAEDYASHFQQTNGGIVVVTRGMEGAVAFDGVNLLAHDGYKVDIVDPVGAGDAFVAGFLGTILENTDLRMFLALEPEGRIPLLTYALRVANVCGALTCTRHGDTAAMPSMAEVNRFLSEYV